MYYNFAVLKTYDDVQGRFLGYDKLEFEPESDCSLMFSYVVDIEVIIPAIVIQYTISIIIQIYSQPNLNKSSTLVYNRKQHRVLWV